MQERQQDSMNTTRCAFMDSCSRRRGRSACPSCRYDPLPQYSEQRIGKRSFGGRSEVDGHRLPAARDLLLDFEFLDFQAVDAVGRPHHELQVLADRVASIPAGSKANRRAVISMTLGSADCARRIDVPTMSVATATPHKAMSSRRSARSSRDTIPSGQCSKRDALRRSGKPPEFGRLERPRYSTL